MAGVSPYSPEQRYARAIAMGVLVDPEDEWLLYAYTWSRHSLGYAYYAQGKTWLHHCIVGFPIWEGDEVDHINRVKLDNRRCNLRYASRSDNQLNREVSIHAKNVYINGNGNFFIQLGRKGRKLYGGTFKTLAEAEEEVRRLKEELDANRK